MRYCRNCRGTGIDRKSNHRYTTGGHDDRSCPDCDGMGVMRHFSEYTMKKEKDLKFLLKDTGWQIRICNMDDADDDYIELSYEDGSMATGEAANIVIAHLKGKLNASDSNS